MEVVDARPEDDREFEKRLPGAVGVCRRWVALESGRVVGCALLGLSGPGYWADASADGEQVHRALDAALWAGARARGARTLTVRPLLDASDPAVALWESLGYDERSAIRRWRFDIEKVLVLTERVLRRSKPPSRATAAVVRPELIPLTAVLRGRALGGDFSSIERRLRDPDVADAYDLRLCRVALDGDRLAAVWLARSLSADAAYLEALVVAPGLRGGWPLPLVAKAGLEAAYRAGLRSIEAETSRRHGFFSKAARKLGREPLGRKVRLVRRFSPQTAIAPSAPVVAVVGLPPDGAERLHSLLLDMGLKDAPDTRRGWLRRMPRDPAFWDAARGRLILLPPALCPGLPRGVPTLTIRCRHDAFVLEPNGSNGVAEQDSIETNALLSDPGGVSKRLKRFLAENGIDREPQREGEIHEES